MPVPKRRWVVEDSLSRVHRAQVALLLARNRRRESLVVRSIDVAFRNHIVTSGNMKADQPASA